MCLYMGDGGVSPLCCLQPLWQQIICNCVFHAYNNMLSLLVFGVA